MYAQTFDLSSLSQSLNIDPLDQSHTSIRSAPGDTGTTTSLVHPLRNQPDPSQTMHESLPPRRRSTTRRHRQLSFSSTGRDRRNSNTEFHQPLVSQSSQQDDEQLSVPLKRTTEALLNEHLAMMLQFMSNHSAHGSMFYGTQNASMQGSLCPRLNALPRDTPMRQRCSRLEIKAFIDFISGVHMNREHHYSFLTESVHSLLATTNNSIHHASHYAERDDEIDDDTNQGKRRLTLIHSHITCLSSFRWSYGE